MATIKPKRPVRKAATATKAAAKPAAKKAAPKAKAASKPAVQRAPRGRGPKAAEQTATLVERVNGNGEKLSVVANDLNLNAGDAKWLLILHEVDTNPKLKVSFKNEQELVAKIRQLRAAKDEYSAWHWIAARTGVAEGKIKRLAEANGIPVKGSQIARERSNGNGAAKKTAAPAKGKATAAKGKRPARRTNPS
jgi:hypothetical protein